MKCAVDLHIHSCLSPCGDESMTPNNIVNMSIIKGLDIIALTDHNSAENCEATMKCGEKNGLIVIPGMEVQTLEEVHVITLFKDIESSMKFQSLVYDSLPKMENREEIFGKQIVMDENDNVVKANKKLLIGATALSIEEVFSKVEHLGGIAIPAHIDRESYSIISNLGIIPENLNIKYVEVSKKCNVEIFVKKYKYLKKYKFIKSSDAHYLGNILEKEMYFCTNEKSITGLFDNIINN